MRSFRLKAVLVCTRSLLVAAAVFGLAEAVHHNGLNPFDISNQGSGGQPNKRAVETR